jgi:hypothetical protein
MAALTQESMQGYLSSSITSLNQNKLRGLLAEVDLRTYLADLGFAGRVSRGGWIVRTKGPNNFGQRTIALFPEIVAPGIDYSAARTLPAPDLGLHTICATFHQSGIASYYCAAVAEEENTPTMLRWQAIQLGLPVEQTYSLLIEKLAEVGFRLRARPYNFLRYTTELTNLPETAVAEEFTKEHLRISFNTRYMAEISDIDGLFWGTQHTYPLEIKEKTPASSPDLGPYFGLDVGPFVKLAYYAAKRGNLHSLFIVREIDNETDRNLVAWRYITFDHMAQFASWVPMGGGTNMQGGRSSVVCIPKSEFSVLNAESLSGL